MIILKYNALFKVSAIPTTVAESIMNMHSYKVRTFKKPIIIATMNKEGDWEVARHQSRIKNNSCIIDYTQTLMFTDVVPLTQVEVGTEPQRMTGFGRMRLRNETGVYHAAQSAGGSDTRGSLPFQKAAQSGVCTFFSQ